MREQAEKELDQENELGTKRPPLGIPTPSAGSSDMLPWFRPTGFHFFEFRNEEDSLLKHCRATRYSRYDVCKSSERMTITGLMRGRLAGRASS